MTRFAAKSMFFSDLKVYSPRRVASSFPALKLARCPHSLAPTLVALPSISVIPFLNS